MTPIAYITGFIIALASVVYYKNYVNVYSSIRKVHIKRYDYVIVGAGTTGCVLAARLSEDLKTKVLLIEAGDHMSYFTKIPLTATTAQLGPADWSVRTTSQRFSSFGLWNQTQILPRGKGLGGSGQINFLMHDAGFPTHENPSKINSSNRFLEEWSISKLKSYFVKAFGTSASTFDSGYFSPDCNCSEVMAPMKLKIKEKDDLTKTFIEASRNLGSAHYRIPTATIKDGVRHSTYDGYLKPALNRLNLHVLLKTVAVSIRFENQKANSIYILKNGREFDNIFVNKEIILATGAIKTPQILILSGIGPQENLKRLNLRPVSINEQIGHNLHDHMNMPIYVRIKDKISLTLPKVFSFSTIWKYYWGEGPLAYPPIAGLEYQEESALKLFSLGTASERLLMDLSNYMPQVFRDTYPFHNVTSKEGFMFLATCLKPKSRGTVSVDDISISVQPKVDPGYLKEKYDVECMIKAIRRAEKLVNSNPFKDIGATIHWPRPERCRMLWRYTREDQLGIVKRKKKKKQNKSLKKKSKPRESPPDEFLECILREVAVTGHHVAGTCAGGFVVDEQLRLKSVEGVRIIDASVFPEHLSLHPNSVLIAMAEKASDLILNRYK